MIFSANGIAVPRRVRSLAFFMNWIGVLDVLDRLGSHAGHVIQSDRGDGFLEILDRFNPRMFPECTHRLGAEPGDLHDLQQPIRDLATQ